MFFDWIESSRMRDWSRVRVPSPARNETVPEVLLFTYADVAQLVEHFLGKEEVTGSIPVISSKFNKIF